MTIVTAMVSPSARPRARIVAPKMPGRADGRITRQVVSQHVGPRGTAFSFMPRGTARITSRETAVSVGRIITANTREAMKRLRGEACDSHPTELKRSEIGDSRWSNAHGPRTYRAQIP